MSLKAALLTVVALMASNVSARELTLSTPWTSALQISPLFRYSQASIFGEGSVPAYRGMGYGAELDYTVGTQELSMGPYFSYVMNTLKNTASNGVQSETLEGSTGTLGLKVYTSFTYLKIGLGQTKIKDKATGTVNNTKQYKSNGLELGGGINFVFSDTVSAVLGLDFSYYKIDASANNISNRLDYLGYGIGMSVRFSIPSISPKDR